MCDLWNGFGQPPFRGWYCSNNIPYSPVCTDWWSVSCDSCNNVIEISFSGVGAIGTISPSIGDLVSLTSLKFPAMGLAGSIPTTISALTQLQSVDLSSNRLTGTIPNVFQNLLSLSVLNVQYNGLTGYVPASICSQSNLQFLYNNNLGLVACSGTVPKNNNPPSIIFY